MRYVVIGWALVALAAFVGMCVLAIQESRHLKSQGLKEVGKFPWWGYPFLFVLALTWPFWAVYIVAG
jgi:hypothetical protein